MGPNEQNQHTQLRQIVGIHIRKLVHLRSFQSLDGKHDFVCNKKGKRSAKLWSNRVWVVNLLLQSLSKNKIDLEIDLP